MRKLILTIVAGVVLGAPVGQAVRADDTTVIKRDNDADQSRRTKSTLCQSLM
jgi:hypothetical protein